MGRSAAASKRQDQRNDFIGRVAADLGLPPEVSTVDRMMLAQAADLLLWNPLDMDAAIRRADAVRRRSRTSSTVAAGNGRAATMTRQTRRKLAGGDPGMGRLPDSDAHVVAAGDSP
jgi:hypothetical protein